MQNFYKNVRVTEDEKGNINLEVKITEVVSTVSKFTPAQMEYIISMYREIKK